MSFFVFASHFNNSSSSSTNNNYYNNHNKYGTMGGTRIASTRRKSPIVRQ